MDPIIKINKNSDFDFEYRLNESWSDCPFRLTFYTIDKDDNFYIVSYDGIEYSSCTPTDHNSVIAHLDHPELYCGCLRIEVEYFVDSASFYDGIYNDIRVEKTNVYIVRDQSDVTSVLYEGSPIINFDPTNLTNNVEQALNDISDKNDALEEALVALEDAQETANGLIEELNEWKETTDNLVDKDTLDEYAKLSDLGPYMTEDEVSDWLNNYYTKSDCNTRYYTKTQIDVMLNEINPTVDLSNYATKADLAAIASGGNVNLEDYVSKNELSNCGYLTQHQSLNDYATKNWVYAQNYITLDYIDENNDFHVDLDGYVKYADLNLDNYATKTWVQNQNYLTEHQSLEGLASQSWVENKHYLTSSSLTNYATKSYVMSKLSSYATTQYVETRLSEIESVDTNNYATKTWVQNQNYLTEHQDLSQYATKSYVLEKINEIDVNDIDLSSYVSKTELSNCGYLTQHQSLNDYATKSYVMDAIANAEIGGSGEIDLSSYATKAELASYVTKDALSNCGYITAGDVSQMGYITSHQSLEDYATKSYVMDKVGGIDLSQYPSYAYVENRYLKEHQSLADYVTKNQLSSCGYLTQHQDLSSYVSYSYLADQLSAYATIGYVTGNYLLMTDTAPIVPNGTISDLFDLCNWFNSNFVTDTELSSYGYATESYVVDYVATYAPTPDLSNYATMGYVTGKISQIQTVTYNMTPTIWQGTLTQYNDLPDHTSYQLYLIAQQ